MNSATVLTRHDNDGTVLWRQLFGGSCTIDRNEPDSPTQSTDGEQ